MKEAARDARRALERERERMIEKDEDFVDGGTTKSRYRKTGVLMC